MNPGLKHTPGYKVVSAFIVTSRIRLSSYISVECMPYVGFVLIASTLDSHTNLISYDNIRNAPRAQYQNKHVRMINVPE